jgi:hypothetical protein
MNELKIFKDFDFDHIDIPEECYLFIRKSSIAGAGDGLFTCIDIFKNEIVSVFKGVIINLKEAEKIKKSGNHQYFMDLPSGRVFDTSNTHCYAKYANDSIGNISKNNAVISMDGKTVVLVAIKKIKAGSEIFTSYGNKYWGTRQLL